MPEDQADRARIEGITDKDLTRVRAILGQIGGEHVAWGASSILEVWIAASRMEAERQSSRRILFATWVLAIATLGLVAATVGLIVVTLAE